MALTAQDAFNDLELKKLQVETRKMLADMQHDLEQQHNWQRQEQHWKNTERLGIISAAVTLIIVSVTMYKILAS